MAAHEGKIEFEHRDDVVELTWQGYISEDSVGHAPAALVRFMTARTARFALFDACRVTGFSADSRVPGGAILSELKRLGVKRTHVVTDSSLIRMIGSTVALAVGLSIRFHESRAIAEEAIASERTAAARTARP